MGFSTEDWALHPKTGICTRRLGFAPDYLALLPTTGLCSRLLEFHPTTGLSSEYRVFDPNPKKLTQFRPTYFHSLFLWDPGPLSIAHSHMFHSTTELRPDYWSFNVTTGKAAQSRTEKPITDVRCGSVPVRPKAAPAKSRCTDCTVALVRTGRTE